MAPAAASPKVKEVSSPFVFANTNNWTMPSQWLNRILTDMTDDGVQTDAPDGQVVVLLFLFVGLGLGVIVQQIMTRTQSKLLAAIPYTVLLFLIGLAMAGYSKSYATDEFNTSLQDWVRIDADLMLFVFLPPLVFGEAMSLNWHHWRQLFSSCLLLAGPGVILGTVIFAMFVKLILPYGWSWLLCLLFSAVLAATDTVSVLSIMNQAGASPKLTMLIVGESLLNDGTGMVLFELFLRMLKTPDLLAAPTIEFILSLTLGSVSLGIAIGLITVRWLRSVNRPLKDIDSESQIAITIIVAYLAFFLAQHVLNISGLLCLVGAALMLAWLAPPIILNRETMHHIWGFVEWTFNTIIFLLAGLIIGHRVLGEVVGSDWMYLIILYLLSSITRYIVVFCLYPALANTQHKLAKNEAYFAAFAGLRGALGMALGLLLVDNAEEAGISARDASRCFFYIGGVVALTLLINGTCATLMLEYLDLGSNDSVQNMLVMDQIKRKLRHKMNRMVDKMEKELDITPDDMADVRMSCSILRPSQLEIEELLNAARLSGINNNGIGLQSNPIREYNRDSSQHISQRLTAAHLKAEEDGTLDGVITPFGSKSTIQSSYKDDEENEDDEDSNDDDLAGASGEDDSDDYSDQGDSWLHPDQILQQATSNSPHDLPDLRDGSIGPYSDNFHTLVAAARGGTDNNHEKPTTMPSNGSSLTDGGASVAGVAMIGSRTPGNGRKVGGAIDISHSKTKSNTAAQTMMSGSSGSGRMSRSATHTGHSPRASDLNPANLSEVNVGSGKYDYTADTLQGVKKRRKAKEADDTTGMARTRTWSVGSYLGGANREGRASRYSKASNSKSNMTDDRAARYSTMSTLLDPTRRKGNDINKEMLSYVRTLFLEIVRVKYWKLIESGKLPRNSHSSQFLLYSVDVGIDEATYNPTKPTGDYNYGRAFGSRANSTASSVTDRNDGLMDWACIEEDIDKNNMFGRKTLVWWEAFMPWWLGSGLASSILEWRDSDLETRQVYMLSAFIEAHEHAQRKIHSFVGVDVTEEHHNREYNPEEAGKTTGDTDEGRNRHNTDDTEGLYMRTPEEIQVKSESVNLVSKAKYVLENIEDEVCSEIRAKQAAMTILHKEVELVRTMNEEGLLTNTHAEKFLEEIQEDCEIIMEDESGMFRRKRRRRTESGADTDSRFPPILG